MIFVLFRIMVIIFFIEAMIMFGLSFMQIDHTSFHSLIDATLLVVIGGPMIYYLVVKPYLELRDRAENISIETRGSLMKDISIGVTGWKLFLSTILVLLGIFLLATTWEFWGEAMFFSSDGSEAEIETSAEKWEFVVTSTVFAAIAILVPIMLGWNILAKRRQVERQLRISEERFKDLAESAADRFWETDENHRFIYVSPASDPELDKELRGTIGKTRWEMESDAETAEFWQAHRATLDAHQPFRDLRLTRIRTDQSKRYLSVSGIPVFGKDETFTGYRGVSVDLTEEVIAQTALKESDQRFRDFAESVADRFWETDENYRYTYISSGTRDIPRPAPEATLGLTRWEVPGVEENEDLWRGFRKDLDNRETIRDFCYTRTDENNRTRYLRVSGVPVFEIDRTFRGYRGTTIDETEEVTAKIALQESETRYRSLFDGAGDGISTADPVTLKFLDVNQTELEHLGYTREEFLSLMVTDIVVGADVNEIRDDISSLPETGPIMRQLTDRRKDGTVFPVEVTLSPIKVGGRSVVQALVRDISERLEVEKALRQAQKASALSNLAGGIAHELNNMLLPILALSKMTSKSFPEGSSERARLEKIVEASERAKNIVDQLLSFSRWGDAKQEDVDAYTVINQVMKLIRASMPATIEIKESLNPETGLIHIDHKQIEAILTNLTSNAIDAMGGKIGEISVSLSPVTVDESLARAVPGLNGITYAHLSVSDTGCGMNEKILAKIFDPFFTTKEVGEGTGLGLAMVYGVVTKHEGEIHASSSPGEGTRFDIYLPTVEEREDAE